MPAWLLDGTLMASKKPTELRPGGDRRYAHIVGWGTEIPEKVLTNFDLERMVDTNDQEAAKQADREGQVQVLN